MDHYFNHDEVAPIQEVGVRTFDAAVAHATSSYWVAPLRFDDEAAAMAFNLRYATSDVAESGLIHYKYVGK